jgi:hypothetical protein
MERDLDFDLWMRAFTAADWIRIFYAAGKGPVDEFFPWEMISVSVSEVICSRKKASRLSVYLQTARGCLACGANALTGGICR